MKAGTNLLEKKLIRDLLASIRESCIYYSAIPIETTAGTSLSIKCSALREGGVRNLEEVKILVGRCDGMQDIPPGKLLIQIDQKTYTIPYQPVGTSKSDLQLSLCLDQAKEDDRRVSRRKNNSRANTSLVSIRLPGDALPILGYAKLQDFDSKYAKINLKVGRNIVGELLPGAFLEFLPNAVGVEKRHYRVVSVKTREQTEAMDLEHGNDHAYFDLICCHAIDRPLVDSTKSILDGKIKPLLRFSSIGQSRVEFKFHVDTITERGFIATLEQEQNFSQLPNIFFLEETETNLRFSARKIEAKYELRLVERKSGAKFQWYGLLSSLIPGINTFFSGNDCNEVSRLLLETGNYSIEELRKHASLGNYFESRWSTESPFLKTRIRWLLKNSQGRALGHCACIRAGQELWSIVDDVGLSRYHGSWHQDYFSTFNAMIVEALRAQETVNFQWTCSNSSGVWTEFVQSLLSKHANWLVDEKRLVSYFTSAVSDSKLIRPQEFEFSEISLEDLGGLEAEVRAQIKKIQTQPFFKLIAHTGHVSTEFQSDFESDFGMKYQRFFYLITRKKIPFGILTFANFPEWTSLNKGHNWEYIFHFDEQPTSNISTGSMEELVAWIRHVCFSKGCVASRVGILSESIGVAHGAVYRNLIFDRNALSLVSKLIGRKARAS